MLLTKIIARPETYQYRDTQFSSKTVEAIVKEGIDLAKFSPVPLFDAGAGKWCVAGDGHSRLEAIRILHKAGRLPRAWAKGKDFDIPHLEVTHKDAEMLALTANLSRDNFTPAEEAKVFQVMLDRGMPIEEVARRAHKGVGYVGNLLPLNFLIKEIRDAIGRSPDSGGIDKHIASVMGASFKKHAIEPAQQQQLWQKVFCRADLTANFVRKFIDRIAPDVKAKQVQGALFEIPASVTALVKEMQDKTQDLRRAERGLKWLLQCKDSGVLDGLRELKAFLDASGKRALEGIKAELEGDADLLGRVAVGRA